MALFEVKMFCATERTGGRLIHFSLVMDAFPTGKATVECGRWVVSVYVQLNMFIVIQPLRYRLLKECFQFFAFKTEG